MGDYQVRFCERLGVKFPLPTRFSVRQTAQKLKHFRIGIGEKIEKLKYQKDKMSFFTDSRYQ